MTRTFKIVLTSGITVPLTGKTVLDALYDLKKMQEPVKERIVYVAVPVTITEQAKELINN